MDRRKDNLELDDAIRVLREQVSRIEETEEVPLDEACGRVLAEDVAAEFDQPPFPRSPLDGYAVKSRDLAGADSAHPAVLKVIAEADAGHPVSMPLGSGQAVRIMTGAPIPDGADAVVRQEDTDYGEAEVRVFCAMKPWQNYCFRGEDYRKGKRLLPGGMRLGPVEIGVLAGTGRRRISVLRRPKVFILSTGDELTEPGETLAPGKIYDSNLYMAAAQIRSWGAKLTGKQFTSDNPDQAAEMLSRADADLIVTTGGVSVGKKDIMHEVFSLLQIRRLFWGVKIKPGMPTLAGVFAGKPVIGLSGNPYGAAANLHLLVKPVLQKMTGRDDLVTVKKQGVLLEDYPKKSPVRRFVRAYYADGCVRVADGSNDSGILSNMAGCNCMAEFPAGSDGMRAGDVVSCVML